MSKYNSNTIVNYPLEKVFEVFVDLNKREIPKFNDANPIGCSNKRTIKYIGKQKIEMVTTVTGYEKNKLYEVTNSINTDMYVSKYIFTTIDNNSTEISFSEIQYVKSITSSLSLLMQKIGVKKKLKNKMNNIKEVLEKELERRYGRSTNIEQKVDK